MRRGAALVAIALLAAAPAAQAQSAWERLRDSARSWFGPAEDPDAALARLGGTRVLLAPDVDDFRYTALPELRDDVEKLLREARIPYAGLAVRDRSVEVRPRDPASLPQVLSALAATAGPAHDAVDIREAGDGVVSLVPTERSVAGRLNAPLDQAVTVIRSRLAASDFTSAAVRREQADRILVIAPGLFRPEQLVQVMLPVSGLEFRLVDVSMTASAAMQRRPPEGSEVLFGFKTKQPYLVRKQSTLGGHDITDAKASSDVLRLPAVEFRFTACGAREFGRLTQENVGRPFAIVLDNMVVSTPIIQTPILGGFGQITGNFTADEADRLAARLRAGALPLRLIVVEQTTVPPPPKN
jgi:preprotein translocase subunit SecD